MQSPISILDLVTAQRRLRLFHAWEAALRSGKYTQGKGMLTAIDENGNRLDCCLGVVCDLHVSHAFREIQPSDPGNIGHAPGLVRVKYNEDATVLPGDVQRMLGFWNAGGSLRDENGTAFFGDRTNDNITLTSLNDVPLGEGGCTFPQIADVIRYCWINELEAHVASFGAQSAFVA